MPELRLLLKIFVIASCVNVVLLPFLPLPLKSDGLKRNCTDFEGLSVAHGDVYVPSVSVCSICVCNNTQPLQCRPIQCLPPKECSKIRAGERCCELLCQPNYGSSKIQDGGTLWLIGLYIIMVFGVS